MTCISIDLFPILIVVTSFSFFHYLLTLREVVCYNYYGLQLNSISGYCSRLFTMADLLPLLDIMFRIGWLRESGRRKALPEV